MPARSQPSQWTINGMAMNKKALKKVKIACLKVNARSVTTYVYTKKYQ